MKRLFYFALIMIVAFCSMGCTYTDRPVQATEKKLYAASTYSEGIAPRGGIIVDTFRERIDYAYKTEDNYFIPDGVPAFVSQYGCGISAGGVAISYYDRQFEELIPNHTGKYFLGKFLWGSFDEEVKKMHETLFALMGSNPLGVTIDGYLSGMKTYVANKGRTATFTNTMTGANQLNVAQYKAAIKSGKLLSIFMDGFSIIEIGSFQTGENYDTLVIDVSNGAHIMTVYGYRDVSYYNANNVCFRKDSYLYVSSGFSSPSVAFVKINQYCTIDDCYSLSIY